MFPTDNCFQNRILKAAFSPSKSSGNPMITLELEVTVPTIYNVGGQDVDISGVKSKYYVTTTVLDKEQEGKIDTDKTKKARKNATKLLTSLGVDVGELDPDEVGQGVDWNNIDVKPLEGKLVFCKMSSNVVEQRKTPTAAELELAKKNGIHPSQAGVIMTHPITGKKLVDYWPQIDEVYGAVPA